MRDLLVLRVAHGMGWNCVTHLCMAGAMRSELGSARLSLCLWVRDLLVLRVVRWMDLELCNALMHGWSHAVRTRERTALLVPLGARPPGLASGAWDGLELCSAFMHGWSHALQLRECPGWSRAVRTRERTVPAVHSQELAFP